MIETQFETPFGTGRVLIYNDHCARFWADKGSGSTLTINGVELTVDFQISPKDNGTWEVGYYQEPRYGNTQRSWCHGHMDIKRADWISTDKTPSNSARDKVREIIVPAFIEFIKSQGDLLKKAQYEDRVNTAQSLEVKIMEKRQEIEKLYVKLQEVNLEVGRARRLCANCYKPECGCATGDIDVLHCAVPDCPELATNFALVSICGEPKSIKQLCHMHTDGAAEDAEGGAQ